MAKETTIQDKTVEWMEAVEEAVKEHSPEVAEVGLTVVQIIGLQSIATGLFFLILALAIPVSWYKTFHPNYREEREKSYHRHGVRGKVWGLRLLDDDGDPLEGMAISGASLAPLVVFSIVSLVNLLNVWNWIAIFAPEVWVAYQAVEGMLN